MGLLVQLSVCLNGLPAFGQSNIPRLGLIRRKQPPMPLTYAHPASILDRDSAASRRGGLFATKGQAVLSGLQNHVHGYSCGVPYISLRLSFSSDTWCNLSAYIGQVSEHYDDKASQIGFGDNVYKALQSASSQSPYQSRRPLSLFVI